MATATRIERTGGLRERLSQPVDAASVGAFRFGLGALLLIAVVRSWQKGVIEQAFIAPSFFFPYYGFSFVVPPGQLAYALYALLAVLALLLSFGVYTRLVAASFCLLFTYAHFVDVTHYLNHYYLVTLLSGLLAVVPESRFLSVIGRGHAKLPSWALYLLRFQVGVVYFFGGVAKLKSDWLFQGEPLRTWLAANTDVPLLGPLFTLSWVPLAMSWFGAAYDLTVPFALLNRRTRPFAYVGVVVFHLLTARLFQIGMFPFIMMVGSLLFLAPDWPRRLLRRGVALDETSPRKPLLSRCGVLSLGAYALVQMLVPLRHFAYPGNVLWTEEGYRWSWNVMLIEKTGSAEFTLHDRASGVRRTVFPRSLLTRAQNKAMATQPDMILAFARELSRRERALGHDVAVYADVFVALNGRAPRRLVDPRVDLSREQDSFAPKPWILR